MLRPRRSVRNTAIEKKASLLASTSNPVPSPPSPPQISNQDDENEEDEPEKPLRLLEPRECVGRSIQIGLNEEIELIFKNPPSSERSSPVPPELKTQKSEILPTDPEDGDHPPKFLRTETFIRYIEPTHNELDEMVEYEMDEMVEWNSFSRLQFSFLLFRIWHGSNK